MTDASPVDLVDTKVTEEPSNLSPVGVIAIIPFIPTPPTTQPEETPQSTVEPTRMNDEVVDNTIRDLDPFSPPPKDLVLCPLPLVIREVIDLNLVPGNSNVHGGDSNLNDPDVNVDEDPLPQWKKGKARLQRSLDASFDVGAISALLIHKVKTRKGQAPQGGAERALAGRIRRDPLWLDRSNPTELVSRNR